MPSSDPLLYRLVRRLIVRSFPRLRRLRLTISWGADQGLLFYSVEGDQHLIEVDDCLRPASRRVLEGGIAHELCHIDADLRMRKFQRELAWVRYMRSPRHRMHEERATDWRVIELGYGPQLLAFVRFAHRLGHTFAKEDGLRAAEIRHAVEAARSGHAQDARPSDVRRY